MRIEVGASIGGHKSCFDQLRQKYGGWPTVESKDKFIKCKSAMA